MLWYNLPCSSIHYPAAGVEIKGNPAGFSIMQPPFPKFTGRNILLLRYYGVYLKFLGRGYGIMKKACPGSL